MLTKEVKVARRRSQMAAPDMIGESPKMITLKNKISVTADSDARVLITGQNGTGKELVAKSLHYQSSRKNYRFIEVNCAAIPSELIESELFGHEKGSFTGASKTTKGKFEQANGGTIFLDEIGDMSLAAQAKVLRALQENKITRVGGDKEIPVDVRVIAATNKDLNDLIIKNQFREDLFHRLAVIEVQVPPLNDRRGDIPLLINHFIENISTSRKRPIRKIHPKAVEALKAYNYTGNIRELRNMVERLLILGGTEISLEDVNEHVLPKANPTLNMVKRLVHKLGSSEKLIDFIQKEYQGVK